MNIERGDSNYDRVYDAPRAPSDSSLSPPWEHGRRAMAPPPGVFQNCKTSCVWDTVMEGQRAICVLYFKNCDTV